MTKGKKYGKFAIKYDLKPKKKTLPQTLWVILELFIIGNVSLLFANIIKVHWIKHMNAISTKPKHIGLRDYLL